MPQLIKGFQELYPKVQFLFHQGDYTSIQEWIKTCAVDFGFITPPAVADLETMVIKNGEMLAIGYKNKHSLPIASQQTGDDDYEKSMGNNLVTGLRKPYEL